MKIFVKVADGKTQELTIEDVKDLVVKLQKPIYLSIMDQILVGEYTTISGVTIFRLK